jgi:hypothetical protein
MYSRSVSEARIAFMSKKIGFELERHSIGDVKEQNKRLNELVGNDGRLIRPLSDPEERWCMNERLLCKLDFRYWHTRYAYIRGWDGQLTLFKPNIAQNVVMDIWAMLEEQRRAISIQELKARQLGVSTIVELAVAHRVQFYKHVNALTASSDPFKSTKMAEMMERCWENQPWWMMPRQTAYRGGELIEFGDQDSGVSIQHGNQTSGIARGDTPTVAHLSELCDFANPQDLVDASLLRAMHESRWMFLVLESTAKGRQNWWHQTWLYSKQYWASGMARLYPMFLPWFVGSDIYPTETWLHSRPIPREWDPSALTIHHAERAKAYVKSDPVLMKFLGEHWEMPPEQMWWWEVTRQEYAAKKELSQFYSETPADDMEAFQSTNVSAFDSDTLTIYRERTRNPIGVFGFVGREDIVPTRLQPDRRDIDPQLPPITVRAHWNTNADPIECQLVPLKFHGYPRLDPHGKLLIYEMPEDGEQYGIGVDTGDGVGLDRSVIEAVRKGTIERNDAQVAEFVNPYINSYDLWPLCMAVGTLYSTRLDEGYRQAKMVIDCLRNGESTQLELRKHGWGNFHQWIRYDSKNLSSQRANKIGWFQNSWARTMMMDKFIKAIRDEVFDINSPYFVDEMADLERDEYRQSLKAVFGGFDDRIMALGMVYFSLNVLEIRGAVQSVTALRMARRGGINVDPVYSAGVQANDDYRDWSTRDELLRERE